MFGGFNNTKRELKDFWALDLAPTNLPVHPVAVRRAGANYSNSLMVNGLLQAEEDVLFGRARSLSSAIGFEDDYYEDDGFNEFDDEEDAIDEEDIEEDGGEEEGHVIEFSEVFELMLRNVRRSISCDTIFYPFEGVLLTIYIYGICIRASTLWMRCVLSSQEMLKWRWMMAQMVI